MPRKAEVQEEVKEVQDEVQAEETNTEKPGVEYVDHAPLFRDGEKYKTATHRLRRSRLSDLS